MTNILKRLEKFMAKTFQEIEAEIQGIHLDAGVTNADVTKKITDAVSPVFTQLNAQQTQLDQNAQLISDIVDKLNGGDTNGALAAATAAQVANETDRQDTTAAA